MMMSKLFTPIRIKDTEIKNRIMLSPMCQYQVKTNDGTPNNWHFVHLVSRAVGGTGLICFEMTNVEKRGRITENCLGIWDEYHINSYRRIVEECQLYGAKVAIQIAHAGRKSTIERGDIVAPSPVPFSDERPAPRELRVSEIEEIVKKFGKSTRLAVKAGFDIIELHGAHGYLLHQFLSPISNKRIDEYGEYGRFPIDVIREVRRNMPSDMPLIMRISAVEYAKNGYGFDHIKKLIPKFIAAGVDAFDVSTGGNSPNRPEVFPGYQVKYAEAIKEKFTIPVISVGALEDPFVAAGVVDEGRTDMIGIGKGLLRSPYWMKEAAEALGENFELPGVYDMGYIKRK
jgi:NADPH2 dehydrogenase